MIDLSLISPELAGRLTFRPAPPTLAPLGPGQHSLGLSDKRDAILHVPEGLEPGADVPLMVLFHGAGGGAGIMLPQFEAMAEARKFLILAPQSMFPTWDLVIGGNGPDRERLDAALSIVGRHFALRPGRIAFAGWSDGCSYALSIGLTNGAFVSHVMAMSGGFMSVTSPQGEPKVFVAHGRNDEQLPVARAGRGKVAELREAGYDVTYLEHDGIHKLTPDVAEAAVRFFLD
ncbi:alpha/beta hydrolase [Methylobrevis pamukkalensis]|uniref:Putative hydrolase n=1 Tax=Methylobrevis pamukkalensis TaxID=1439726 RepID=A0A1E3GYS5_9HYPH|nr:esterase [Methylobrevis pamukkalensis]ODN68706.1 putative hydrolase [Methylobrevis pamukkalensis]